MVIPADPARWTLIREYVTTTATGAFRADPRRAGDYIVVALLAQMFLAEPVTAARWTGIGFIVLGVFLVSRT